MTALDYFMALTRVPRPPHHEEKVTAYILNWAQEHGFAACADETGNVYVDVPAAPGAENAPWLALQAHMDMVCVADPGVEKDFLNEPVDAYTDGNFVRARGTSLGADNGGGVALMQYIATAPDVRHPALRLLFTVTEEDGMEGASQINPQCFEGITQLINLDEENGLARVVTGCAGTNMYEFTLPLARQEAGQNTAVYRLEISGLKGGHSGIEIHRGRAHAVRIIAHTLALLQLARIPFTLQEIHGGTVKNAISDHCYADIVMLPAAESRAQSVLALAQNDLRSGYGNADPDWVFTLKKREGKPGQVFSADNVRSILTFLNCIHSGVRSFQRETGCVDSSLNIGTVRTAADSVEIGLYLRAHSLGLMNEMDTALRIPGTACGFQCNSYGWTPPWPEKKSSRLADIWCNAIRESQGTEPEVCRVHAGLEAAIFANYKPEMDVISIGPVTLNIHSTGEALDIESLNAVSAMLVKTVEALADHAE